MKLTGDYTLFMDTKSGQREGSTYKVTEIEIKKENSGFQYGKVLKTFTLKTVSAHGEYHNSHIGMVWGFTLRNNETGENARYEIGRRPHATVQ